MNVSKKYALLGLHKIDLRGFGVIYCTRYIVDEYEKGNTKDS